MRTIILAEERSKYIPSHKRAQKPPPMRLTQRDKQIILAVYTYRLLSAPQIEALFFPSEKPRGCRTSCQRRLQLLYHHGFLSRIQIPVVMGEGRYPLIYALDNAGADLVASRSERDRADLKWKPKDNVLGPQYINHLLAVNDFRVVMTCLTNNSTLGVKEWIDETEFRLASMRERVPSRMRGARIIRNFPDGYFSVMIPGANQNAHFFLEVDMGTETNTRWQDKVKAYVEYRDRGLSSQHFGTRNFRLLTVTTTTRRLKNLKQSTEKAGGDHHFWFATQDEIDIWQPEKLLEPVWSVATKDDNSALFPQLES